MKQRALQQARLSEEPAYAEIEMPRNSPTVRLRDAAVQHHDLDGASDAQHAALVRPTAMLTIALVIRTFACDGVGSPDG
jgi:hypothetical protein